jgi:NADPH:quinone reductase-like Zn-dependent oxidoreductase
MKTIGLFTNQGVNKLAPFVEREMVLPVAIGHDVLVRVEAISVNPVDLKRRASVSSRKSEFEVLGWDAAGTVEAIGELVTSFKHGDRVFYAGDITRS